MISQLDMFVIGFATGCLLTLSLMTVVLLKNRKKDLEKYLKGKQDDK